MTQKGNLYVTPYSQPFMASINFCLCGAAIVAGGFDAGVSAGHLEHDDYTISTFKCFEK
jgi:hypothetical protein